MRPVAKHLQQCMPLDGGSSCNSLHQLLWGTHHVHQCAPPDGVSLMRGEAPVLFHNRRLLLLMA